MGQTGDQSFYFMQNKTLFESNDNGVQIHLFEVFKDKEYTYTGDELNKKGIKFLLSNSASEFILEQYQQYDINLVKARRSINSKAIKRGSVDEVLIRNYE